MSFQVNATGRVTAGVPSLTPEKRERVDLSGLARDRQLALLADVEGRRLAASKADAGHPTHVKERQKGIPLEGWRIAARLKKLNANLHFELANADSSLMGIYYLDPLTGKRFICGMYRETNQEFETRVLDKRGECKKTLRGWRTVLSKLIRGKFISEAGAFRLFGPPSRDSENWALQVN